MAEKDDGKKSEAASQPHMESQPDSGEKAEEEMKERLLRLAAEFDNYKKRARNDIDAAKGIGKAEIMKELLPVLDEFELALMSVRSDSDKTLVKGVEMIYSNLLDVLKKDGLSELKAEGTFDPYKHEIIMVRVDQQKKPGTILEVTKKGYAANGVLLRPASVIISKPAAEEAPMQKQ
jgi:molecular chaperone GrpE